MRVIYSLSLFYVARRYKCLLNWIEVGGVRWEKLKDAAYSLLAYYIVYMNIIHTVVFHHLAKGRGLVDRAVVKEQNAPVLQEWVHGRKLQKACKLT